jgi:hypothetical protein
MRTHQYYDYPKKRFVTVDLINRGKNFYKELMEVYINDDPSIYPIDQTKFDHDAKRIGSGVGLDYFLYIDLPPSTCIAGGSIVNYLTNQGYKTDIDIFFYGEDNATNVKNAQFIIDQIDIIEDGYHRNENYIDIHGSINKEGVKIKVNVQLILSAYSSFNEVINSFDLYPSQVGYNNGHFYGTKKAIFALSHMVNPFDISRANTSYINRIRKYHEEKGFYILLLNGFVDQSNNGAFNCSKLNSVLNMQQYKSEYDYEIETYNHAMSSETSSIRLTYRKNLQHLMDPNRSLTFDVLKEGQPLCIGEFKDILEGYSRHLERLVRGEECGLSYLGTNLIEVHSTFNRLLKEARLAPPLSFRKKEGRFRECTFDESGFYVEYMPIWKRKLYQKTPWIDRFVWWVLDNHELYIPNEIKDIIMLNMTAIKAIDRMQIFPSTIIL